MLTDPVNTIQCWIDLETRMIGIWPSKQSKMRYQSPHADKGFIQYRGLRTVVYRAAKFQSGEGLGAG